MKKIWILCFIILKNFSQTQCVLKPRSLSLIGVQSKTKFNTSDFMRPWEDVLNKKFNLVICIRNGFPVSLINSLLCCEISYNSGPKEPEKWSPLRFWQVYTEVKTFSIKRPWITTSPPTPQIFIFSYGPATWIDICQVRHPAASLIRCSMLYSSGSGGSVHIVWISNLCSTIDRLEKKTEDPYLNHITTVAAQLRVVALMETQHFFSKGHSAIQ